jgi:hypothetical protein
MPGDTINFDQALELTLHERRTKRQSCTFQILTVASLALVALAKYPLVGGMCYLEKEPPKFECL